MLIEVIRPIAMPKALDRTVWTFWLNDRAEIILQRWVSQSRPTNRHKFTTMKGYDRSGSNYYYGKTRTTRKDILIPESVVEETKKQIFDKIILKED